MALNSSKLPSVKGDFPVQEPLEEGTYPARLVHVIALGLQEQRPFKGEEKPPVLEIYLTYELADEFVVDEDGNEVEDKPRFISERMPFHHINSDRAKSTKRYRALDPTLKHGGDWTKLLGTPCLLSIVKGKPNDQGIVRNYISDTSPMRKKDAEKMPELVNPVKVFDTDEPDMTVFFSLPSWLQDVIKGNLDYEGSALESLVEQGPPSSEGGDTQKDVSPTQRGSQSLSEGVEDVVEEEEDW